MKTISKGSVHFILALLIVFTMLGSLLYYSQQKRFSNKNSHTIIAPNPSLSPANPIQGFGKKSISLNKLSLEVPDKWWYEIDEQYDNITLLLNKGDYRQGYFWIRIRKSTTKSLEEMKNEQTKAWHIINVTDQSLTIDNIKGKVIKGVADPRLEHNNSFFQENNKAKIAFFILGEETYEMLGIVDKVEKEYDQILSTFKFVTTLKGRVVIIGNEPFTELVLQSEQDKSALFIINGENKDKLAGMQGKTIEATGYIENVNNPVTAKQINITSFVVISD